FEGLDARQIGEAQLAQGDDLAAARTQLVEHIDKRIDGAARLKFEGFDQFFDGAGTVLDLPLGGLANALDLFEFINRGESGGLDLGYHLAQLEDLFMVGPVVTVEDRGGFGDEILIDDEVDRLAVDQAA